MEISLTVSLNSIKTLVEKAAKATDSGDAMRFSQAAVNAGNALMLFRASADKVNN